MKKFALKSLLALVLVIGLAMSAFVACGDGTEPGGDESTDGHDYKITVIGLDGKTPYTSVEVYPCDNGGEGSMCHGTISVNDKGVAYFDQGEGVLENCDFDELVFHASGLPKYLGQKEDVILKKGECGTIYLVETLDTLTGNGTAEYVDGTSDINTASNFAPYQFNAYEVYKISFTSKDQKIYVAFQGDTPYTERYSLIAKGGVDLQIVQLQGTVESGLTNANDDKYKGTNTYEFDHDSALIDANGGISYFELSLKNAEDVGKGIYIYSEWVASIIEDEE